MRPAVPERGGVLSFGAVYPELGAALLSGKIDYARALDPVTAKKVQATLGCPAPPFTRA